MNSSNKIIFNTIILYAKMVITLVITLYSTRLALNALGSSDLGIFYLVAGVISLLSFLNTAMSISTQRFLSFNMGKKEINQLKEIFNSSVTLHLFIGIVVIILLEVSGIILFNSCLNIPPDRVNAAWLIFHFMAISAFLTIITVPYDAVINSNENMVLVAILGILDSIGKLVIAVFITYYQSDRLIMYGGLLSLLTLLIVIFKRIYCYYKYEESKQKFRISKNQEVLKELFAFAGWNMYGTICGIFRSQGITIVLNNLFGTVINAAYGISNQVNGQLSYFASAVLMAFNPRIMKSEGSGERDKMLTLSKLTSKYSFYLLAFFAIPLIIEIDYVLEIWLKDVPEYTVTFCQLILILTLVNQLTVGLQSSAQAVGNIKIYQLVIGTINLIAPILGYFALRYSQWDAPSIILITIIIEVIAGTFRIAFLKKLSGLSIKDYLKTVISPSVLIFSSVFLISWYINSFIQTSEFARLSITTIISSSLLLMLIYLVGMNKFEKSIFKNIFGKILKK